MHGGASPDGNWPGCIRRRSAVTAPKKPASGKRVMEVRDPSLEKGELKAFGGSRSDDFNRILLSEVGNTLWTKHSSQEWQAQQLAAVAGGLRGIEPRTSLKACSPPKPWRPITPPWNATAGRCCPSSRSR